MDTHARDGASILSMLGASPSVGALARALDARRHVVASGASGSSSSIVCGALALTIQRPVILVTAHIEDSEEARAELLAMMPPGASVLELPALEAVTGADAPASETLAQRLRVLRMFPALSGATVVCAPIQALMQLAPTMEAIERFSLRVRTGERLKPAMLLDWLDRSGYARVAEIEEPGEFAVRGGIVDIFPPVSATDTGEPVPVRLDFFGDEVERIFEVDAETSGSVRALRDIELVCARVGSMVESSSLTNALELLPRECAAVLSETMEVVEQARGYYERVLDSRAVHGPPAVLKLLESRFRGFCELNQYSSGATLAQERVELPVSALPAFPRETDRAVRELASLAGDASVRTIVCCLNEGERKRCEELLTEHASDARGRIELRETYLHRGFVWRGEDGAGGLALVPYHELVSRFGVRRGSRTVRAGRAMDTFLGFEPGDAVVHQDHGVALYQGMTVMRPRDLPVSQRSGATMMRSEPEEYLILEFAGKARVFVPATQIDLVQKYVGGFAGKPPLSVLGGQKWKSQKERVAESVRDLAAELLRVRAAREHLPGVSFPHDTSWQREFEEEFPYEETPDQLGALQEIKRDMHQPRPMDRLICGDVGFGKTELAIRAAFKACEFGKQVAVLVPTTVLCEQHERTFRARFAGYPFRVESISRFKTDGEVRAILKELREGRVDVIIGTHRLLSQDVVFGDLGLVVVDEEQRFGVEHKESLLRLRLSVDVLTLSATPIPRTLHMAMLGIRDISSLTTPPADRRAIVTEVIPYNQRRIQQAIARELAREGQVYFVHNRVHDIRSVADTVQRLAGERARVVYGHGQMSPHELEEVMLRFMRREADILVSTTIIESGIDIPTANTMIINDADRFGLSELHQLRGRVGRSRHRAYCYLLLPETRTVKDVALKRLKALEQYSMLGAGFKIAMRDLEIRGAGNILGPEQSGHIAAVGYDMYCRLLEQSVRELKHEQPAPSPTATTIEIGVGGMLPRAYIPSDTRRLAAYRRIATCSSREQLEQARKDIVDAYGEPPEPAQRLFDLAELRLALSKLGVRALTLREKDVVFICEKPQEVASALERRGAPTSRATVTALPPKTDGNGKALGLGEVYFRPGTQALDASTLLPILRVRLGLHDERTAGSVGERVVAGRASGRRRG